MPVFLSPGVTSLEQDLSDFVESVATSSSALVGYSARGDVENVRLITNQQQFIEEYGEPDPTSGHYFHYAALAFLAKGNVLYCLRVENGALWGGADIMATTSAESNAAFTTGHSTSAINVASGKTTDVLFQIKGANPGAWNSRVGIKIQNVLDGTATDEADQYTFEIVVQYQDDEGNWSDVELWKVSRKNKVDGFGKQLYLEDKINGYSKYIIVADNDANFVDTVLPDAQSTRLVFGGGSNGSSISSTELVSGWAEFENPEDIDVRILINGGETAVVVQQKMLTVAEGRADCIAVLDVPFSETSSVTDTQTFRDTTQNFNSSYCALYAPWVRVYDQFNDQLIFVPPSGYVAARYAFNDQVGQPWTAPMGFRRGLLEDVVELNKVYTKGERDVLYPDQINPIQLFKGEGIAIWGQKTEQVRGSATNRVNVRRMLIVIEKAMAISLRQFVGENNTETNRFRVVSLLEQYLGRLSSQGAFQTEAGDRGYRVVCDTTNNTAAVIDANELHVDVFIKPVKTAEFIQLKTIVTSTGASFDELIARGVLF